MKDFNSKFLFYLATGLLFIILIPMLYVYYSGFQYEKSVEDANFRKNFIIESGIREGSNNAKVVIEEYFAVTCGACKRFYPVLKKIKEKYSDSQEVAFVHYDFPIDEVSLSAIVIGRSIKDNDKFMKFIDYIITNPQDWYNKRNYELAFEKIAINVSGFDLDYFANKKHMYQDFSNYVMSLRDSAINDRYVNGIPFILINGKPYEGERTFIKLDEAISLELNK